MPIHTGLCILPQLPMADFLLLVYRNRPLQLHLDNLMILRHSIIRLSYRLHGEKGHNMNLIHDIFTAYKVTPDHKYIELGVSRDFNKALLIAQEYVDKDTSNDAVMYVIEESRTVVTDITWNLSEREDNNESI